MNILMVTGSPKKQGSASLAILQGLEQYLKESAGSIVIAHGLSLDPVIADIARVCDVLVLAFPLYVDSIPSNMLTVMERLERENAVSKDTRVFAIVNCGFYEGEQADLALEMTKHWCERCGAVWGGGLGFGGGGGLGMMDMVPMGYGPKKNLGAELKVIAESIIAGKEFDARFASVNFPAFLYKLGAQSMWRSQAKSNGLKRKDLSNQL